MSILSLIVITIYYAMFLSYFKKVSPRQGHTWWIIGAALVALIATYIYVDKAYAYMLFPVVTIILYSAIRLTTSFGPRQSFYSATIAVINVNCIRNILNSVYSIMFLHGSFHAYTEASVYNTITLITFPIALLLFMLLRKLIFPGTKLRVFIKSKQALKIGSILNFFIAIQLTIISSLSLNSNLTFLVSNRYYIYSTMLTSLMLITIIYVVIYYSLKNHERVKAESRNEILRQQFEMQLLHYQNTEKQYEKYRQFKHDYQANIDLLRNLINDNLNTEAQDLINEMENHEIVQFWNRKHFTNNVIFDSMMQELARKCKDANIKLFFEGQEPRRTNLTLIEKITLFHNITFNAYEANLKLKEEERYILIRVNNQDAWTSIHVENAFDGNINYKDGKYHSTKTNGDEHGIGLENVEEVTQKLGGVLTITPDTEKRIFYLCVLLPSHGK